MSVLIKGMEMPKNCHECPLLYVTSLCDGAKACPLRPIVRCEDCKHLEHSWVSSDMNNNMIFHCNSLNQFVADDFFCAYGER